MLDRVGRLQLPHEFVQRLELRDRVRLALEPDHVGVWPGTTGGATSLPTSPNAETPTPAHAPTRPRSDAAPRRPAGIR